MPACEHKFTHTADVSARIVVQNALFLGRQRLSALTIPLVHLHRSGDRPSAQSCGRRTSGDIR